MEEPEKQVRTVSGSSGVGVIRTWCLTYEQIRKECMSARGARGALGGSQGQSEKQTKKKPAGLDWVVKILPDKPTACLGHSWIIQAGYLHNLNYGLTEFCQI